MHHINKFDILPELFSNLYKDKILSWKLHLDNILYIEGM